MHLANHPGQMQLLANGLELFFLFFFFYAGFSLESQQRLPQRPLHRSGHSGLHAIKSDTYGDLAERDTDFIALLSPLCSTGELGIKVCGLIKFSAVQPKRQLVYIAHLHP